MWTPSDLRTARREMAKTLTAECIIEREGVAGDQDALGGTEFVETSVSAKCRVDMYSSPREVSQGGQIIGSADHAVILSFGTVISRLDTIVVGTERFEVIAVNAASDRFCETAQCVKRGV